MLIEDCLLKVQVRAFARGLEVDLSAEVLQEVKKCTVDTEGVAFARHVLSLRIYPSHSLTN